MDYIITSFVYESKIQQICLNKKPLRFINKWSYNIIHGEVCVQINYNFICLRIVMVLIRKQMKL
jgi:CRISPR/Cas system CMR-associated protein Cmr3 (group 5 of RAMP superfamily)